MGDIIYFSITDNKMTKFSGIIMSYCKVHQRLSAHDIMKKCPSIFHQIRSLTTSRSYYLINKTSTNPHRTYLKLEKTVMSPKKVCIVGSGNWGSAIARLVGVNTARFPDRFVKDVNMWVFEEEVNGRKLTEIINTDHENVKYLPGRTLPTNIVAVPDISDAALDADILIFVLPHQFIKRACAPLKGKLKEGATGLSLIKGFQILPEGGVELISQLIRDTMNIPCGVLMGANLANEVADEKFCETTIG